MKRIVVIFISASCIGLLPGCKKKASPPKPVPLVMKENWEKAQPTPMPKWAIESGVSSKTVCGIGVAGRGYDPSSPYPKELCEERAVRNLAGVFGTKVQEAIIDINRSGRGTSIERAQHMEIAEGLIDAVKEQSKTDYWYDVLGEGPFTGKGFTYCRSCVETGKVAQTIKIDPKRLEKAKGVASNLNPAMVPEWVAQTGAQKGGRLCAVGFALPHFHAEESLGSVVDDIRIQLSEVITTLVSSYSESLYRNNAHLMEVMTVATTEAISKGAVVTHYWYDKNGIGPHKKKRTTYGWGCVYPNAILKASTNIAQEKAPMDRKTVEAIKERAQTAFDDLEAEIEKSEQKSKAL